MLSLQEVDVTFYMFPVMPTFYWWKCRRRLRSDHCLSLLPPLKGERMEFIFTIILALNIANPDNIKFINTTIENNKKYECSFKWKGISPVIDRPAIDFFGYTAFKEVCK